MLAPLPIRVVVAEDSYLVREGVRRLLDSRPELDVVATCEDLDSLLTAVAAERPDVLLTDIRMPPDNRDEGIRAAQQLRETDPELGVVVLSQYAEPAYALALLDGGADRRAYLLKERIDDLDQLAAAIQTVASGGSYIDPRVVETLVSARSAEPSPLDELTPRERDVLSEMARGSNNAAIAETLFLAERSVEKVIHSIFLKLGLGWETGGAQAREGRAALPRRARALTSGGQWDRPGHGRPAPSGRADREPSAERADAVAHAGEAGADRRGGRVEAGAVVGDLEAQRSLSSHTRATVRGGLARVLRRVLERLQAAEVDRRLDLEE